MALPDSPHRLVHDLPQTQIRRPQRLLPVLKETAEPLYPLENPPQDHEPQTPEEAPAVAEAWREHREGKSLTTEEVKRELGLS